MSRIALGAAALIAACWSASAQAADLPYGSRAPYTVNQPLNMYSWAGPYLGGNIGWAWGSVDNNPTKPSGFVGGAQAGYNWQTGPWVFGVEGDMQATGASDTFAPWKFSNPWFGTVRGRAGYAFNNILFYGTARSGVRRTERRRHSACRKPTPTRAGPRGSAPNSALRPELEREDRISLCRSQRQQFHCITGVQNGYRFGLVRAGVNYHF